MKRSGVAAAKFTHNGDRQMSLPQNFNLQAELAKCKTADDLTGKNGLVQRLIGNMLEQNLNPLLLKNGKEA
jgi:hypothetical protein